MYKLVFIAIAATVINCHRPANCGAPGQACCPAPWGCPNEPGQRYTCEDNICTACGEEGQTCCDLDLIDDCEAGLDCADNVAVHTCTVCGALGEECCIDGAGSGYCDCDFAGCLACESGTCEEPPPPDTSEGCGGNLTFYVQLRDATTHCGYLPYPVQSTSQSDAETCALGMFPGTEVASGMYAERWVCTTYTTGTSTPWSIGYGSYSDADALTCAQSQCLTTCTTTSGTCP